MASADQPSRKPKPRPQKASGKGTSPSSEGNRGKKSGSKQPSFGKPRFKGKNSGSQKKTSRSGRRYSAASNWKPALISLKKIAEGKFIFEPPACALERDLDLEEVHTMITGGELEIARDELLYLVADCRGFLEAYCILAELALEDGDIPLAKGHYGFAYENGLEALPKGFKGKLPYDEGYNSHFFKAGRGLARCLIAKGELKKGREVLEQLLKFDPSEPESADLLKQLHERESNKNA